MLLVLAFLTDPRLDAAYPRVNTRMARGLPAPWRVFLQPAGEGMLIRTAWRAVVVAVSLDFSPM